MIKKLSWQVVCVLLLLVCQVRAEDPPKVITVAEAIQKVNEDVRLEMKVNSASLRNEMCFLNSEQNFKDEKNFTVFISREVLPKFKEKMIDDPAAHFQGKTVQVRGKVTLYKERPQIALTGPDAIKIVEKNAE